MSHNFPQKIVNASGLNSQIIISSYDVGEQVLKKFLPRRYYLNPIFDGGVADAPPDGDLRCSNGRLTKIPYFRGGGSGGTDGGNDGSRIFLEPHFDNNI